jgi:hypothetical protein
MTIILMAVTKIELVSEDFEYYIDQRFSEKIILLKINLLE